MRHRVHSATTGGEGDGRGHNGGVWEWTSTEFGGYEGFVPSSLYPGFSADFFDSLHNVVVSDILFISLFFFSRTCTHRVGLKIGGSYVTTPRQAERRSLRNFFQRNNPYSWIGGRVAYDVAK
jgi:formylglycine-generating enzyme required for sulfatase activity